MTSARGLGVRRTRVDDGLRRRLQLVQGLQWLRAAGGDPFAALLRSHDEDVDVLNAQLRRSGGIRRSATGTWVVARYRVATAVLADPAFEARFADWRPGDVSAMALTDRDLGLEAENRVALSGPVGSPTGRDDVARRHSRLATACDRVLVGVGDRLDLATMAAGMSVEMLAELLDLPADHRDRLADSGPFAGLAADSLLCPQGIERTERMLAAIDDLREVVGGRPLDLVLAVVGIRVCTDLLLHALLELLSVPRRWAALRGEPASAGGIVTETLRHDPPVQVQMMEAVADTEVERQPISAGSQVAVLLGAANRDPEVFADPDRFDPDRTVSPQRAALLPRWPGELVLPPAREQAEVALAVLATRLPGLTASGPPLRHLRAPASRGVLSLPALSGPRHNERGRS